jgi:transposase
MGAARKYPDELRDRAVRLVLDLVKDQEISVTAGCRKVGAELGINADTLRGWAKQARVDRGCGRGRRRRTRRGSGRWSGKTLSCAGPTRSCARRAPFPAAELDHGNPGRGLYRGLPRPVRGRAHLPGAAPGGRGDLAGGVLRGPGVAAIGAGGARRRGWRSRSCGSIRTAGNATVPGRCRTS